MTVSPASQRRINRAVNQWIKVREEEKRLETLQKNPPNGYTGYGLHWNRVAGTWTKRNEKSGKFVEVKTSAKPFRGRRSER